MICDIRDSIGMEPDYGIEVHRLFGKVTFQSIAKSSYRVQPRYCPSALLAIAPRTQLKTGHSSRVNWPSWTPDFNHLDWVCLNRLRLYSLTNTIHIAAHGNKFSSRFHLTGQPSLRQTASRLELTIHSRPFGVLLQVLPSSALLDLAGYIRYNVIDPDLSWDFRLEPEDSEDFRSGSKAWAMACGNFVQGCRDIFGLRATSHQRSPPPVTGTFLDLVAKYAGSSREETREEIIALLGKDVSPIPFMGPERYLAFMTTETGKTFFAWVPPDSLEGDAVSTVYGAPYPFVLRKTSDSEAYQLVGDAYVHEIKEKDAVGPDVEKQQTIVLR
jgi:hypothetical protein